MTTNDAPAVALPEALEAARRLATECEIEKGHDAIIDDVLQRAADTIRQLCDAIADARRAAETRVERLRLEAQTWAQEARTQRATVHEAYQAATGATGEPGDWHGAEPIRAAIADARREALAEPVAVDAGRLAWEDGDEEVCDWCEVGGVVLLAERSGPFWWGVALAGRDDADDHGVYAADGYAPTHEAARQAAAEAAAKLARDVLAALVRERTDATD